MVNTVLVNYAINLKYQLKKAFNLNAFFIG